MISFIIFIDHSPLHLPGLMCKNTFGYFLSSTVFQNSCHFCCIIVTQQNSVHVTCMGLNRCRITEYSIWSHGTYINLNFLHVIFCYCSYTRDVQLISEVLHFNVSFICWSKVIMVLFCVLWSLCSWKHLWSRRQGVRRYHNGLFTDVLGDLFEHDPDICLFLSRNLFLVKSKTSSIRTTLSSASL